MAEIIDIINWNSSPTVSNNFQKVFCFVSRYNSPDIIFSILTTVRHCSFLIASIKVQIDGWYPDRRLENPRWNPSQLLFVLAHPFETASKTFQVDNLKNGIRHLDLTLIPNHVSS